MLTRNAPDWTARFQPIATAAAELKARTAYIEIASRRILPLVDISRAPVLESRGHAIAVELDLVQAFAASRRAADQRGELRRDEGRQLGDRPPVDRAATAYLAGSARGHQA